MNKLIVSLLPGVVAMQANATPGTAVVGACLRTASSSPDGVYTPIDVGAFEIIDDRDAKKTSIIVRYQNDTVGTWEGRNQARRGLVFNGKETPLTHVISLDKGHAPTSFSPYEAMWGVAQEGKKSYICATFNFDGLGKSGSFQNVRGVYLFDRSKHATGPFYAVGNISASEK